MLPSFTKIDPKQIVEQLDRHLNQNREKLKQLLAQDHYTWDNLIQPIEDMDDELNRFWSPISHLKSVKNSPALREQYNKCLPKLTEYGTELGHNKQLFAAIKSIKDSSEFSTLNKAQQKIINDELRDFHLAGVDLDDEKKKHYSELKKQLSKTQSKFEENLLDATDAWSTLVTDKTMLSGLPKQAIDAAKQEAEKKNQEGWLFTLKMPSYIAVMQHADSAELREKVYRAHVTRASEKGPHAGQFDNTHAMETIVGLRQQVASVLGFNNYAEYSLATKMAESTDQVLAFLHELAKRCLPQAKREFKTLQEFAQTQHGKSDLQVWDLAYYSEKLKEQTLELSQEELRPYFPLPIVLNGLFEITKRLFGMHISSKSVEDTWHPDVQFFEIKDEQGNVRGQFYLDLYARDQKRGGAWMDECIVRRKQNNTVQTPVAYLTCNFGEPIGDQPALLTHDEVVTLFHEFGHGLHHMLTLVDYAPVSGINGVPWDAVEMPSQFLEHWCYEKEGIALISKHFETGVPLPDDKIEKLKVSKHFQSAMAMLRQLEFALFDFRLHMEFQPGDTHKKIQTILDEVRQVIRIVPAIPEDRFQHSFSHIFAGGYAAGYYSYKWAEVLSCDAYSLFLENGIFDHETGRSFLHTILEQGGTDEPQNLFKQFRGREPKIDALLALSGIKS